MNIVSDVIRKNTAIQIMLFVVILVVVYFGYRGIANAVKKSTAKKKEEEETKEMEEALPKGEKATYSTIQYKDFADKLEIAMKGVGTDYKAIKEVFKAMENDTDIIQLKKAFGLRGEGWFSGDENLNQWLQGDLSSDEIKELNALLETKGITFRF